jgi:hypothetical protein
VQIIVFEAADGIDLNDLKGQTDGPRLEDCGGQDF